MVNIWSIIFGEENIHVIHPTRILEPSKLLPIPLLGGLWGKLLRPTSCVISVLFS